MNFHFRFLKCRFFNTINLFIAYNLLDPIYLFFFIFSLKQRGIVLILIIRINLLLIATVRFTLFPKGQLILFIFILLSLCIFTDDFTVLIQLITAVL